MLILVATDATARGGVDGHVTQLLPAFQRAAHSTVLVLEQNTTSALRDLKTAPETPVTYAALSRRHPPDDQRSAARDILDSFWPDGVHAICGSPRSCLALRDEALARGVPLVIAEHQVDDALVVTPEQRVQIRSSYQAARHVVFLSEGNRTAMDRLIGLDGVRTSVIPSGVPTAEFHARTNDVVCPSVRGGARVMAAARLAPEKGLDVLVRAVATLPRELVREVNIFGEGPERPALERLVDRLGETGRVTLHPWTTGIPELMAQHHLFVLPSTAEGLPFVVLEAMSVGTPVIATDVPGSAEALDHGAAGTLVARGDFDALASAIVTRLKDETGTAALADAALRRVRTHYELATQMRRTVGVWSHP